MIKFDSYDTFHKNPLGALRCGDTMHFRVEVRHGIASHVNLVVRGGGGSVVMLSKTGTLLDFDIFEGDITLGSAGLYFYRFEIVKLKGAIAFAGTRNGHTAVCGDWLPEWRLAVYERDFKTPRGFEGAVMYQIFPDRFFKADGVDTSGAHNERIVHKNWDERPHCFYDYPEFCANDFFMGNLRGIEQKLDYIASLGVTHIYLNPIFESAENHRYSTSDYLKIDPYLGTEADFVSLCKRAKEKGISIILDGVFSHTGDDSKYFNKYGHFDSVGAYRHPESPYYDWYSFQSTPDEYECWWGFKTLPNVCESNPKYMNFITGENGVLRYWMRKGASGWRLDVADELPDCFLEAVRSAIKAEDENAVIIGEVWENAVTKHSYGAQRRFLLGRQCDTVMNYPFLNAVTDFAINGNAEVFYESVMRILSDYPAPSVNCIMNMLSTHDTSRILNRLGVQNMPERRLHADARLTPEQRALAVSRLMIAIAIQYTLPGVPCLYYGDEAGLEGFGDPACRGTYPWGREDMTLLDAHRTLGQMRKENPDAFTAPIKFITHSAGELCYTRGDITLTVNRTGSDITLSGDALFSYKFQDGVLKDGGVIITRR